MPSYNDWFTAISSHLVVDATNTDLITIAPTLIIEAENRIYRDLDMMVANVRDGSASTVTSSRNFNLPTTIGTFQIVDDLNLITPANTAPEAGARTRIIPVSLTYLDYVWGSNVGQGPPVYWAYVSQNTYLTGAQAQNQIVFGPWPDNTYRIEVIGKIQPAPMSASNLNTYLTDNLFDLLIAASMVAGTAWQQNFGAAGTVDNAPMAVNWETQYQKLKGSADDWEARKKHAAASWTSKRVEQSAQPQRG